MQFPLTVGHQDLINPVWQLPGVLWFEKAIVQASLLVCEFAKTPDFRLTMLPKTILIVAAVSAVSLAAGVGSMFVSPHGAAGELKKAALEQAKFSSAQMPDAVRCYDNLLVISPDTDTMKVGSICKCLMSEVQKYAPAIQPALQTMAMISLDASAQSSSDASRSAFIAAAFSTNPILQSVKQEQNPILQNGINHVFKSCPLPRD